MTAIANCGDLQQTLLILFLFAAGLLQLFLTLENVMSRRLVRFFLDGFLLFAELVLAGALLNIRWDVGGAALCTIPAGIFWLIEAALLIYAAVSYLRVLWKIHHSLSRESIKEGIDNLRDGVCFFDVHGAVRLINRKMLSVGIMLYGSEIQSLHELHAALLNPPDAVERLDGDFSLYRFPDGAVRRFTEHAVTDPDKGMGTEVIAADVTELYAKQAELNSENARLADANGRMKRLLDNMSEIVREEEILSMKMRIHDDIGHSILSARKALLQQQDIVSIRENAALWETAVDLLDRANKTPPLPDEWETVKTRAGALGVEVRLCGVLPESEFVRHLLILAVRECVTNCVRHAGGSEVFVTLTPGEEETTCVITNNGKAPEQEIVEGGGLSSLRRRIEREGGVMKLQSRPLFSLTLRLPMKEELL